MVVVVVCWLMIIAAMFVTNDFVIMSYLIKTTKSFLRIRIHVHVLEIWREALCKIYFAVLVCFLGELLLVHTKFLLILLHTHIDAMDKNFTFVGTWFLLNLYLVDFKLLIFLIYWLRHHLSRSKVDKIEKARWGGARYWMVWATSFLFLMITIFAWGLSA